MDFGCVCVCVCVRARLSEGVTLCTYRPSDVTGCHVNCTKQWCNDCVVQSAVITLAGCPSGPVFCSLSGLLLFRPSRRGVHALMLKTAYFSHTVLCSSPVCSYWSAFTGLSRHQTPCFRISSDPPRDDYYFHQQRSLNAFKPNSSLFCCLIVTSSLQPGAW